MEHVDQMEQLRAAASALLAKAQNATVSELASAIEKATGVIKLSSELEKSQAEVRKLALEERKLQHENDTALKRERSEKIKEYVSLLTPIVTIFILAATLIAQNWQFIRSERDKNEAALDAQWEDTVKTISQTSKVPPAIIALHPFLSSPKYAERARVTAVQLLANSTDKVFFNDLFGTAFIPLNWNNLDYALQLDRALYAKVGPLYAKTYNEQTDTNDLEKLTAEENALFVYTTSSLPKLSLQISSVLKTPRPDGRPLDLSATELSWSDWRGVNMSGANMENTRLNGLDLKDANLDKITQFTGAHFYHTAWWEAARISPELLGYLEKDASSNFRSDAEYGPGTATVKPGEYAAAIARLKNQPH